MKQLFLTRANRLKAARAFRHVPRVDMGIEATIEAQMGKIVVDDEDDPTVFNIDLGFFVYYAGDVSSDAGQMMLAHMRPFTMMMAASAGWAEAAQAKYGERLRVFDRYSFDGSGVSAETLTNLITISPFKHDIQRIDLPFAQRMPKDDFFVDLSDFESAEDFVERGIGFYAERGGDVIGAAYSSLVCNRGIEVSIFVVPDYRRQGLATALAAHLVKWCHDRNWEANWDAANPESCILANKLGYSQTNTYQAYFLRPADA